MTSVAQNAAVHALERRLVYRLKDDVKGFLIKASLESVTIDQDRIAVTFSVWQFTVSVLLGVVSLIAGFLVMFWLLFPDSLLSLAIVALLMRRNGDR